MANFDLKDYFTVGGLGLGGAGLLLYSQYKRNKAKQAFRKSLEDLKADVERNPKEYQKLRDISGVDVNISGMSKPLVSLLGRENAFFTQNKSRALTNGKLLADKVKGVDGLIALGPDNKSLAVLAHELGHGKNSQEEDFRTRQNKRAWYTIGGTLAGLATSVGGRSFLSHLNDVGILPKGSHPYWSLLPVALGTGLVAGGHYLGDTYNIEEESQASKNAVKFLKEYGRLPKELRKDRKALNKALDTYKTGRTAGLLSILGIGLGSGALFYGINRLAESDSKSIDYLDDMQRKIHDTLGYSK